MKIKKPALLIISVILSQLAGIIGSTATISSIPNWYATLNKPFFNPPNWIFAPVWTTLYTLMGIALYLVWLKGYKNKNIKPAINLFLLHLVLNAGWSLIFFGLQNLTLALIVILILWLMIAKLILMFNKINKYSAYLLVPYLLWVSFATLLNFSLLILN